MKRREFCAVSLGALGATAFSWRALAAAADELPILSRTGAQLLLKPAAVGELKASLRGSLLSRGNEGYEQARHIWNGAFDRYPAAIVRCANEADVAQRRAVRQLARSAGGGARRWPQPARPFGLRGRAHDRSRAHAGGERRSEGAGRRASSPVSCWAPWTGRPSNMA